MSREVRAQALLLESVVTHRLLPGIGRAVVFPDSIYRKGDAQVVLVDDRDPSKLGFPPQIRIVNRDDLETNQADDQLPILEFMRPENLGGKIGVRLRLSITFPDRDPVPLGEIVATFDNREPLTAVDPTHVLAY